MEVRLVTGFSVNRADLQSYADVLGHQQQASAAASHYLARYATLPEATADSLFAQVALHHTEICSAVDHGLHDTSQALGGSAQALLSVKRAYQNLDAASAARIDGTIQDVARSNGEQGVRGSFTGLPDPTKELRAPEVPEGYPDPFQPARNLLDEVTMADKVQYVVTQAIGWNPYERYAQAVAGDWHAFARAGQAFVAVGNCVQAISGNVGSGNVALGQSWQGNASDQAYSYFYGLQCAISTFGENVISLDPAYREFADSAYLTSSGVADLLHGFTDDVVKVITVFAAGGTAEIASRIVHDLPDFLKEFLDKLGLCIGTAEILAGLALNIQASNDVRQAAGYVRGADSPAPPRYKPPPQLVH
jgi:hypothetical protein